MQQRELPSRVRVLVLGGGIHGVGILHDLASRGWSDVHLIEKDELAAGTSSRSTKLVHGGLRYLQHIRDFGLVAEALRERHRLLELAPDLVKPMELLFPILYGEGMPRFMVKIGLSLYDRLAGRYGIESHRLLSTEEITEKAPVLNQSLTKKVYSFWDAQTDDMALVRRIGASAVKLGAGISEYHQVISIQPDQDGWQVKVKAPSGKTEIVSALYVVNATGPWANQLLESSQIKPTHRALNNKGVHLLLPNVGLKAGLFLQSPSDKRIFFILPWEGFTLLGTTEELFNGQPDDLQVCEDEIKYLLDRCNRYLNTRLTANEIMATFAGLRWLAIENDRSLTETTRAYVVGERQGQRGILFTLYGGKLTTYRNLSETLGDRITEHFGEFKPTRTHLAESWVRPENYPNSSTAILERFTGLR